MLTSDSIIKFGKYKGIKQLKEISNGYLEQFYNSHLGQDCEESPDLKELMEYIEIIIGFKKIGKNQPSQWETALTTAIKNSCPKEFFINESDAKYRLDYIRKMKVKHNGKNKIPVRAYECEKCGYWHLTSQERSGFGKEQTIEKDTYEPVLKDKWLKLMGGE